MDTCGVLVFVTSLCSQLISVHACYQVDCKAYYDAGDRCSGVYTIKPDYLPAFDVCSKFNVMNNQILSSGIL